MIVKGLQMPYAFTGGRVFIGDGQIMESATVVVDDGRIASVEPGGKPVPQGFEQIDITAKTLCPGFIDCHVHIVLDGAADPLREAFNANRFMTTLKAAGLAKLTLQGGFTTIRDMGGLDGIDLVLRDAIAQGVTPGPRIMASANPVVITGGHGWLMAREADGPADFRKAAREQIKAGADQVKLMATGGVLTNGVQPGNAQATEKEMRAAIQEAHKTGRKTASHAQGTEGILNALRAGIDSIEHGFWLNDEAIEMMLKRGVGYVPTLAAIHYIIVNGEGAGIPQEFVDKAKYVSEAHKNSLLMARDAGVLIGMGTDAGTPFNRHGQNANEMQLMVEAGLSPKEALVSATGSAAKILGLQDEIGMIAKGKQADLVVVDGNPLEDISLATKPECIRMVMKGGEPV
jgi:imidazolonepropionase-like amidohydrolase